ncbi:MAG: diacylglycerol kinase [Planctomycetaceae bacterium]|nr:diacylglycerol kinase [Planctomycetaceae bacterium]
MTALRAPHEPRLHRPDSAPVIPVRRRAIWHQRLIDAEGGLRVGFRENSTIHVHLFVATIFLATGAVLSLTAIEWILMFSALAITIAAELFNLSIQTLADELRADNPAASRKVRRLSIAATMTVVLVAVLMAGGIITRQLWLLFS